jgi:YVTN family beta-propeller protein
MKISNFNSFFIALAMLTILTSCHKDKLTPKTGNLPVDPVGGIYVLNQGNFNIAPGSLTYYNIALKVLVPDQYSAANGKQTNEGNNMAIYGSKMYIVGSGVDIADPETSRVIKHITFPGGHIAFYKGDAFVAVDDSTVAVIDTATLTITKRINIGNYSYPAGLAVANGKLYVAVPGLPDGTDNIVSVIDLSTLTEIKTIDVIHGPIGMAADANGHIIILSPFDDDDFASPFQFAGGLTVIDSQSDRVTFTSQTQPPINNYSNIPITVLGDFAYYFNASNLLIAFNTKTYASTAFVTDHTSFTSPSCLAVNPATGEVFVGDAKNTASNGLLYAFDKNGKLEYTITTGINPVQIVLLSH